MEYNCSTFKLTIFRSSIVLQTPYANRATSCIARHTFQRQQHPRTDTNLFCQDTKPKEDMKETLCEFAGCNSPHQCRRKSHANIKRNGRASCRRLLLALDGDRKMVPQLEAFGIVWQRARHLPGSKGSHPGFPQGDFSSSATLRQPGICSHGHWYEPRCTASMLK